jgi:HAD superfamily hydrolase (TIGR01509 family)
VLVDSEPIHYNCWRQVLAEFRLELDWDTYHRLFIGVSDREMVEAVVRMGGGAVSSADVYARYPRKKELFRKIAAEHAPIAPEAGELMAELNAYRLGVVSSSGRQEVEPILAAAGLRPYFEVTIFGEDVTRHKPDPLPYLTAAERLGVKRVLVVEDSEAGIASGKAAGFEVLRIPHPHDTARLVRNHLRGEP